MDDLIKPAKDGKETLRKLKIVLARASEYGLEIKIKKCQFVKTSVEFLGHRIECGKLYPSAETAKAVLRFPEPTTIKQKYSFL